MSLLNISSCFSYLLSPVPKPIFIFLSSRRGSIISLNNIFKSLALTFNTQTPTSISFFTFLYKLKISSVNL